MKYEITPLTKLNYAATGNLAKLQNARFLLSTVQNSCPMDRNYGIDPAVDLTTEFSKTEQSARIIEVLERSINGLTVESVEFEQDLETGHIYPKVKVVIEDASTV